MEIALEILKYILPAAVVFAGVYFIMQNFMENEQRKLELRYRSNNQSTVMPVRLQAYERIILYLERINLSNLVMRTYQNGMSARELQAKMLKAIRSEYEHNMAQQLYISSKVWRMVKSAKEENIKVINSSYEQLNGDASGVELSQFILELVGKIDQLPTEVAIEALKREINYAF